MVFGRDLGTVARGGLPRGWMSRLRDMDHLVGVRGEADLDWLLLDGWVGVAQGIRDIVLAIREEDEGRGSVDTVDAVDVEDVDVWSY